MNPILLAVLIVTVIGLIGAVILVAASIFMYVPVDERVEQITGCLPGANCGACGCAGCADYAKTIVEDGNAVNKCVPGGAKVAGEIAALMGVEAGASVPMKAVAVSYTHLRLRRHPLRRFRYGDRDHHHYRAQRRGPAGRGHHP